MAHSIDDKRYWDQEIASRDAEMAEAARPKSLSERLAAAVRRSSLLRDGYGIAHFDAERAAARAEVDALRLLVQAEAATRFETEWTRKITIERRAAWNAALNDPRYRASKNVLVGKMQAELGYSMDALKAAMARWAL